MSKSPKLAGKVTVNYRWIEGAHFNHAYYGAQHMQLALKLLLPLGVVRLETNRTALLKEPTPGTIIASSTVYFTDLVAAQAALASAGATLMEDVPNYSNIRPEAHVSEVAIHFGDADIR